MKKPIVIVCAWAALAVSSPSLLQAQTPGSPPGSQGQGQPPSGQTGGKGNTPQPQGKGSTAQPGQNPAAPGSAQDRSRDGAHAGAWSLRPSEELVGAQIDQRNGTGGQIGRINDLVIRPDGSIGYAVLETPGSADMRYPIPWSQLRYETQPMDFGGEPTSGTSKTNAAQGRILAQFDNDRMKGAPSFDAAKWPRDAATFDESERYYGGSGARTSGEPRPAGADKDSTGAGTTNAAASKDARFRASQFKEQVVVDSAGNPIGKAGRLAIDPVQGRVNYVTVVLSNVPGASGRTIAVPWSALRASRNGEEDRLQLNLPADKLANAPQFKSSAGDWAEMSDENWVRSLYGYYGVKPYWSSMDSKGMDPKGTDTKPKGSGTTDKPQPH